MPRGDFFATKVAPTSAGMIFMKYPC